MRCSSPVYHLLGKKGITATEMPASDVALTDGDLAFREHNGGHTDLPDWPVFISFAERYFNKLRGCKTVFAELDTVPVFFAMGVL